LMRMVSREVKRPVNTLWDGGEVLFTK
jgi:hypothetical protein